ncbi:MAG: hypothetical protein LBT11_07315 [Treponema sp.]|jgi:hypothetical protein|nr:hypothetical protein [Treponema sp.]
MNYQNLFSRFEGEKDFIKTSSKTAMDGSQKAALNRRGNEFYNTGKIEEARRIFLTTGYSDGLVRIGDSYKSQGRVLDALRMYWLAPDRKRADQIIEQMAMQIQNLIHEDTGETHE